MNHYSTRWITARPLGPSAHTLDHLWGEVEQVQERNGQLIGYRGHDGHPYIVPWGFGKLLRYIHETYCQPDRNAGKEMTIYVTENGFALQDEGDLTLEEIVNDTKRQEYFTSYLDEMVKAMSEGVQVGGYFAWSLLE